MSLIRSLPGAAHSPTPRRSPAARAATRTPDTCTVNCGCRDGNAPRPRNDDAMGRSSFSARRTTVVSQLEPVHLDADDEHRAVRPSRRCGNLLPPAERPLSTAPSRWAFHVRVVERRIDGLGDHVPRNLEIDPAAWPCGDVERPCDVRGRGRGSSRIALYFGDLAVDVELRFARLHLVVHVQARRASPRAPVPPDRRRRRLLGVGARHRVHHVQSAGAVGTQHTPSRRSSARLHRRQTRPQARGSAAPA